MMTTKKARQALKVAALVCIGTVITSTGWARIVDEVVLQEDTEGFVINFELSVPMRFLSVSPTGQSRDFELQLAPDSVLLDEQPDDLVERILLSWNNDLWSPIKEIVYDGSSGEYPLIIVRFTDSVAVSVRGSSDQRSLEMNVVAPQFVTDKTADISAEQLIDTVVTQDSKLQTTLADARKAILDQDYSLAVRLLERLRNGDDAQAARRAGELIGWAYEKNGQLAQAKRAYEIFIEEYQSGEDVDRVRQYLAVMLTAARRVTQQRAAVTEKAGGWNSQFYGSFAQRYYRDETNPEDGDKELLRDQLVTDLDFVSRLKRGDLEIKSQFVGSHRHDFEDANESEFRPNIASVEVTDSSRGLFAKLGRQNRTTGGVLGRFDGLHAGYEVTRDTTVNVVYGLPVLTSAKYRINDAQDFYGVSVDVADLWAGWDWTGFYIAQDNQGMTDREAVGTELRYFDDKKSFFTLLDYDLHFSELNTFMFIGNWRFTSDTQFNLTLDYRHSPILTTSNAIQGQGVESLEELFDIFNDDELKQLALDRSAKTKTATASLTHRFNRKWQIIGELTATEFGDMPASGGVEAVEATDIEYFYSAQLVANSLFFNNDTLITGLRYGDTTNVDSYTFTANWRHTINRNFRINPRLRIDYRESKFDDGDRLVTKPYLRLDYSLSKWAKLEMDLGYEIWDETTGDGLENNSDSTFISIGYRMQF